jgi:membrane-bound serine protease (ClpP class)
MAYNQVGPLRWSGRSFDPSNLWRKQDLGTVLFIVALILLALACFTMEVITPSFGVLTLAGIGVLVWAIVECFAVSSALGWIMIPILIVASAAYMVALVKILPNSKVAGLLVLAESKRKIGDASPRGEKLHDLVGKTGQAVTPLRPAGTIRVDRIRYDAVAESGMIPSGSAIKVLRARGSDVVVAKVDQPIEPEPKRGQQEVQTREESSESA